MKKFILDCDPGHDDAFAIMLAAQNLDLLGVTTVGGNGYLPNVTRNALIVLETIGKSNIPVYPGYAGPMIAPLTIADNVHGSSGMDGPVVSEPKRKPENKHAVDFIIETVMNNDHINLGATGPLTNIAMALNKEPRIAKKIDGLYIMGGGAYCGNWTPAAEFNIFVDPEAAYKVFHSGANIYMSGVNLTRQCIVNETLINRVDEINNITSKFSVDLMKFFSRDGNAHLHDAVAVAWAIDDSIVKESMLHVDVELNGTLTRGMTVTDLRFLQSEVPDKDIDFDSTLRWNDPSLGEQFMGKEPNTHVGMRLDYNKFCDLLLKTIKNYR